MTRTVLHVIDALNVGGAQELLVLLARHTPQSGYRTLVCVIQPDTTVQARIEAGGATVYGLDRSRPSILTPAAFLLYAWRNIRDIRNLCREHRVDVVHCHLSDAEFLGILAGRMACADRVITTVHYPALLPARKPGDIRNALRIAATRMLYRLTDRVVAVSDDVAEQLISLFRLKPEKIEVIVNGIDVDAIHAASPGPELAASLGIAAGQRPVLSVGRLMPPKGHVHLVEAMPFLRRRIANAKLMLAGDGDLRGSLQKKSEDLGVGNAVSFLGSRDDVHDLLALSEVFVLPSVSEGTSLALLEAMAAGKPIVATDIPGNRSVMRHGENGLLVPPGRPEPLAEAIAFLLDHPETAASYARQACRDVSQRFDIRQTITRLSHLWGLP